MASRSVSTACGGPSAARPDVNPAAGRNWLRPLLGGFSAYLDRLSGDPDATADMTRLLWIWQDDSKDPWHTGDMMSNEFIASVYAAYLDEQVA